MEAPTVTNPRQESFEEMMDKIQKERNLDVFAKDIARQCVEIDAKKRLNPSPFVNGSVFTARQLRDSGFEPGKSFSDDTKFRRLKNG